MKKKRKLKTYLSPYKERRDKIERTITDTIGSNDSIIYIEEELHEPYQDKPSTIPKLPSVPNMRNDGKLNNVRKSEVLYKSADSEFVPHKVWKKPILSKMNSNAIGSLTGTESKKNFESY